jgi:hypothetical protein
MSIEVLAIARSRRGLCCDINAPTLRPFAQKLISAHLRGMMLDLLFAHSVNNCHQPPH